MNEAVIVLRQSPDWGSLDASYLDETEAFDRLIRRPVGFTRRLIELWDATFDVSFFATREAMKGIALAGFDEVRDAQLVLEAPSEPPALVLFSDDDDWFAPDIVGRLLDAAAEHDGLTWTSVRFNGFLQLRDRFPGSCFTNNYALTRRFAGRRADWLPAVAQHVDAEKTFHAGDFDAVHLPEPLSITNKHPCSLMMLEQAAEAAGLVAVVEEFNGRAAGLQVPEGLAWAQPRIDAVTGFFAELTPRNR